MEVTKLPRCVRAVLGSLATSITPKVCQNRQDGASAMTGQITQRTILARHVSKFQTVNRSGAGCCAFHFQDFASARYQAIDRERLLHKVVGTCGLQLGNLVGLDHAGDANYPDHLHGWIHPDALAYFLAIDIRQHQVQHDYVRPKFLDQHPGIKTVVRRLYVEPLVLEERIGHQFYQAFVVIDDQHLAAAAFESVRRDAVVAHERKQLFAWNAPEPAAGNAKSLQRSIVKATDDCLLADFADFCSLARCEYRLGTHETIVSMVMVRRAADTSDVRPKWLPAARRNRLCFFSTLARHFLPA